MCEHDRRLAEINRVSKPISVSAMIKMQYFDEEMSYAMNSPSRRTPSLTACYSKVPSARITFGTSAGLIPHSSSLIGKY